MISMLSFHGMKADTHIALWIVGSPRVDKVQVPKEQQEDSEGNFVEIDVPIDGENGYAQGRGSLIDGCLLGARLHGVQPRQSH